MPNHRKITICEKLYFRSRLPKEIRNLSIEIPFSSHISEGDGSSKTEFFTMAY